MNNKLVIREDKKETQSSFAGQIHYDLRTGSKSIINNEGLPVLLKSRTKKIIPDSLETAFLYYFRDARGFPMQTDLSLLPQNTTPARDRSAYHNLVKDILFETKIDAVSNNVSLSVKSNGQWFDLFSDETVDRDSKLLPSQHRAHCFAWDGVTYYLYNKDLTYMQQGNNSPTKTPLLGDYEGVYSVTESSENFYIDCGFFVKRFNKSSLTVNTIASFSDYENHHIFSAGKFLFYLTFTDKLRLAIYNEDTEDTLRLPINESPLDEIRLFYLKGLKCFIFATNAVYSFKINLSEGGVIDLVHTPGSMPNLPSLRYERKPEGIFSLGGPPLKINAKGYPELLFPTNAASQYHILLSSIAL